MGSERGGAGGDSRIEWRTVNTYIRDRHHGLDTCSRDDDSRARQFSDHNVQLRYLRAAHRHGHRVAAWVARVRLKRRKTVVLCLFVVIVVGYRCLMVLVRGWAVVVLRMIVPGVVVYVQRSPDAG